MIKLDDNLLTELGLQSLPAEEKRALLKQIYETLEMRVGTTLARQMTDAQLDEFESFINNNDEAGALHWLETNFPNYKDVVSQEFEMLKGEIRQAAPQIVANATANQQQMIAPTTPAAQPQQQMPPTQQDMYTQQQPPVAPTQYPQPVQPTPQFQNPIQQPSQPTFQPQQPTPVPQPPQYAQPYYGQPQANPGVSPVQPQAPTTAPRDQSQFGQAA